MNFFERLTSALFGRSEPAQAPARKLTIKGDRARFDMWDGRTISTGRRLMIHDPSGTVLPYRYVFFGPGRVTRRTVPMREMTREQRQYLGRDGRVYEVDDFEIARKRSGWTYEGLIKMIWYDRYGRFEGKWYHPFKPASPVTLARQGGYYRLDAGPNAELTWRGYVNP